MNLDTEDNDESWGLERIGIYSSLTGVVLIAQKDVYEDMLYRFRAADEKDYEEYGGKKKLVRNLRLRLQRDYEFFKENAANKKAFSKKYDDLCYTLVIYEAYKSALSGKPVRVIELEEDFESIED